MKEGKKIEITKARTKVKKDHGLSRIKDKGPTDKAGDDRYNLSVEFPCH